MATLEQLDIVITGQADKAVSALDRLVTKLREVKAAMNDLGASGSIRISIREWKNNADEISEAAAAQKRAFTSAKRVVSEYYRTLTRYARTDNDVFLNNGQYFSESGVWDDLAHKLNVVTDKYSDLQFVREELSEQQNGELAKHDIKAYQDYAVAVDEVASKAPYVAATIKEAKEELEGTAEAESRVADETKDVGASAEENAPSLSLLGRVAEKVKDKFHRLFTTMKRVAMMRLMRWTIRQLVNAAKEGLEILTEWDRTFGNNTSYAAKTVDELAAKWREVKKAVGAALMPIIQGIQPVLNGIMNFVIGIFNTINQIVRAVQGYSTYMKATEISTKSTVGAAKELRRVLFGFDELNVLNGSGGTGAAGSVSPIEFKETKITQDIKDFFKGIDTNLDVNPYLNPQVMEETDTKVKDWLKKLFNIKDEDLQALDEKIMGFFGEEFTKLKEGWNEVVENWHNAILPIKTWLDTHISIPLRQSIANFYAWLLEKHPKLAKFLGVTEEKLEEIRVEIKAIVEENEQLDELYAVTHYKGKFNVNVSARSDLDSNTKKLLELINTGLTEKYIKEGSLKIGSTSIKLAGIKGYADGGIPDIGTLFYAGESGAEVVASSPSGTGVMNVKQMQDAVSNGNVQVVNAVGAIGNMIVAAINNKDMNAYLDGQMITDNVLRRANGMARATGQPVIVR